MGGRVTVQSQRSPDQRVALRLTPVFPPFFSNRHLLLPKAEELVAWVSLNLYPCPGPCSHMLSHSAELTDLHLTSPWQRVRLMLRMMQLLKGRAPPQEPAGSGGWALPEGDLFRLPSHSPPFSLPTALPSASYPVFCDSSSSLFPQTSWKHSQFSLPTHFQYSPLSSLPWICFLPHLLKQLLKVTNKSSHSSDDIFFNLHLSHSV